MPFSKAGKTPLSDALPPRRPAFAVRKERHPLMQPPDFCGPLRRLPGTNRSPILFRDDTVAAWAALRPFMFLSVDRGTPCLKTWICCCAAWPAVKIGWRSCSPCLPPARLWDRTTAVLASWKKSAALLIGSRPAASQTSPVWTPRTLACLRGCAPTWWRACRAKAAAPSGCSAIRMWCPPEI